MPRLNELTFNISYQLINHQREGIQYTFKDFNYNQVSSCADYFSKAEESQCHIYSYPYRLNHYNNITKNFLILRDLILMRLMMIFLNNFYVIAKRVYRTMFIFLSIID